MTDNRRPTPLGVRAPLPPVSRGLPSSPPSERSFQALKETEDRLGVKLDQMRAEVLAHVSDLEQRVTAVEMATREAKDAATSARRTEEKLDKLSGHVLDALAKASKAAEDNSVQNLDIAGLKSDMSKLAKSEGTIAGNEAAVSLVKKHGPFYGLVILALTTMPMWLPFAKAACNAAPHDPKTQADK